MANQEEGRRFAYQAHGESIDSQIRLPEFFESPRTGDPSSLVINRVVCTEDVPSESGTSAEGDGYRLWWKSAGDFLVSREGNILGKKAPEASDALFRLPLLGTVVSTALAVRKRFALHGNAIVINGRAVILVGQKGQGKTTLTACLLKRGHTLLADDLSAITFDDRESATVHRGALQLRLWPDSVEYFFGSPEQYEQLNEGYPKRIVPAQSMACEQAAVPLAGVIVLCESDTIKLEELSAAEKWKETVVHSFLSRLGSGFLKDDKARWHYEQCVQLARSVQMQRLYRPREFSRLDEVASFFEQRFG